MNNRKISESGFKLLTINNAKTRHGESLGVLTGILYLSPEVVDKLCPYATAECRAICLFNAGRAQFIPMINQARTRKTNMYLNQRSEFIALLRSDIAKLERKAKRLGLRAAVRLNGTSDILFERLIDFGEFPNVQFYDYTKVPIRHRKMSPNYHLTFSFSGSNLDECLKALDHGVNVAVVFNGKLPSEYLGRKVIDGTAHDVRFLDEQNVIVGLLPKGNRAKRAAKAGSKFFVNS